MCCNCVKIQVVSPVTGVPSWMYQDGKLYLDLPRDFSLEFFKSVSELSDLDQIKDEATIDVNLPYTEKNDLVFSFFRDHSEVQKSYSPISVLLYEGHLLHSLSEIEVVQSDDQSGEYQVSIQRGEDHWLRKAKSTYLNTLDLGTFVLNSANLQINWGNNEYLDGSQGVYFPLVDYGGWFKELTALPEDLRPWVHILYLLQQGFCSIGWKFRSPWLETRMGRKMIAYVLSDRYGYDLFEVREFQAEGTYDGFGKVVFDIEVFDSADSYNNTTGVYTGAGVFDFTVQVDVTETNSNNFDIYPGIALIKEGVNGEKTNLAEYQWAVPASGSLTEKVELKAEDVTLLAGEKVYVSANTTTNGSITGKFYNDAKRAFYSSGDEINIAREIHPEYTVLDFLKGVAHMGNGKFVTDWSEKTVWMYTPNDKEWFGEGVDGFYLDTIEDLTGKIVANSEVVTLEKASLKRYVRLQFKGSKDKYIESLDLPEEEPLYYKEIDRGTGYQEETEVNENPFFEPTANNLTDHFGTPAPLTSNPLLDLPVLWDNDEGKISYDIGPRVLIAHGEWVQKTDEGDTRNWKFEGGIKQAVPYASQVPGSKVDNAGVADLNEVLVYGDNENDLYSLAWKSTLLGAEFAAKSSLQGIITAGEYVNTDFRKRYRIFYNGATWLGRLLEIGGRKSCTSDPVNLVFRPIAFVGDVCDDSTFVPADTCNNQPRIDVAFDLGADSITATADNSGISSTVDADTWEYSSDEGANWLPYTPGTPITGQTRLIFRRTVTFTDECSGKVVTRVADINSVCENNPGITLDYDEGTNKIIATASGSFNSSIDSDTWTVAVDGAAAVAYSPGSEIGNFLTVTFERVVSFTNSCPDVSISQTFNVETPPCANNPVLAFVEVVAGSCVYDLEIQGSVSSTIKYTSFQVSKDGGSTWLNWDRVPVRGEAGTKGRAIVYYEGDCPPSIIEGDCPV